MSDRRGNVSDPLLERRNPQPAQPIALFVLAGLLGFEAAGMVVLTVLLVLSLAEARAGSVDLGSGVALAVCAAIAAAGLALVAWGVARARKWTRPAALVWQIVQILVGLDAGQGAGGRPDLAALLIVPAVVVIVLLFTPRVSAVLTRRRS